jgi:hypothetical protein
MGLAARLEAVTEQIDANDGHGLPSICSFWTSGELP